MWYNKIEFCAMKRGKKLMKKFFSLIVLIVCILLLVGCVKKEEKNLEVIIKENFEKMMNVHKGVSSNTYDYIQNEYDENIIKLGKDVVSTLVSMYENGEFTKNGLDANILVIAIQEITSCNIKEEYDLTYTKPEEFFTLWKDNNCNYNMR